MTAILSFFFNIIYFLFSFVLLAVLFFLPSGKIKKIYARLDEKEERKRIQTMSSYVKKGDQVLDVGAGSGRFGKAIQAALEVQVSGVDVCDYSDHTIPFFVYDGKKLPFDDKSFDVVFFAFVLHHTTNQEVLLQEACRVARRQVVIFEDTYEYFFERVFTAWNDYHTNILQGWIKYWKGFLKGDPSQMPMPYTFRSVSGWKAFLTQFPINITSCEVRAMGYKPLKKVTFCLSVSK